MRKRRMASLLAGRSLSGTRGVGRVYLLYQLRTLYSCHIFRLIFSFLNAGEVPETTETGTGPSFSEEASTGPHESIEVSVGPANGEGLLAGIDCSVGPGAARETATGPDFAGGLEAGVEVSVGPGAGVDAAVGCMLFRGVDMASGPGVEATA